MLNWKTIAQHLPGHYIKISQVSDDRLVDDINIIQWFRISLQDVYIVGGHISCGDWDKGNVFTIQCNKFAEFNMFLDPLAAKTVFDSNLNITLIPLGIQRRVSSLPRILKRLKETKRTPEANFASQLLSMLYDLQQIQILYHHMVKILVWIEVLTAPPPLSLFS